MTALDAFLPTTAALHRHVAAASHPKSAPSAPSAVASSEPHIAKYIIVALPNGTEIPIMFPQVKGLQHADLVPCGCSPVSAGFCMIYGNQITIPDIPSTSLSVGPRKTDKTILARLLNQ